MKYHLGALVSQPLVEEMQLVIVSALAAVVCCIGNRLISFRLFEDDEAQNL